MIIYLLFIFLIVIVIYGCGFNSGHQYAEDIATGKRFVKSSKDFMKQNDIISFKLRGWADSLTRNNKLEFPLQIAMYQTMKGCDFTFRINTKSKRNSDVRNPFVINVVATRCCAAGYNLREGKEVKIKTIEEYTFSFEVPSYTLLNVYKEAYRTLKCTNYKYRTYESKVPLNVKGKHMEKGI